MATHKVGGEVDAFCTKCKMTLAHTILAMIGTKIARVRCNTCGGDHAYRSEPGARNRAPSAPRASKERVVIGFEQQLQGKDIAKARPYSPKDTYAAEELISHPSFGLGLVTALRGDKVDVAFKAAQKTLVHGRGDDATRPVFHPPSPVVNAPADKPGDGVASPPGGVPANMSGPIDERLQDEDAAPV